jgi:hypothetical protein
VNDTTPPSLRLLAPAVRRPQRIRFAATDAGSGIDPASIVVKVDGHTRGASYAGGVISVEPDLTPGTHAVFVSVADYQETKNMEDVGPILPNTRVLRTIVHVR